MRRVRIELAPGIWRHPAWIIDQAEREIEIGRAVSLAEGFAHVARQQSWTIDMAEAHGLLTVALKPRTPATRVHEQLTAF